MKSFRATLITVICSVSMVFSAAAAGRNDVVHLCKRSRGNFNGQFAPNKQTAVILFKFYLNVLFTGEKAVFPNVKNVPKYEYVVDDEGRSWVVTRWVDEYDPFDHSIHEKRPVVYIRIDKCSGGVIEGAFVH